MKRSKDALKNIVFAVIKQHFFGGGKGCLFFSDFIYVAIQAGLNSNYL